MIGEYSITSMFAELQLQLQTTRLLLDSATDGFCAMDPMTHKLVSVSPQLSDTFGCNSLLDACLVDFVEDCDKHKVEFGNRQDDSGQLDLSPILVTCHRKSSAGAPHTCVFDAQISPYAVSDGQ